MTNSKTKKVFVAMSGGVDSSTAASILKEKGYDVTGVTMKLHPPSPETTGMPVEEGENDGTASADSAQACTRRMNPAKLPNESFGAKTGHLKGTTAMSVGLHSVKADVLSTSFCKPDHIEDAKKAAEILGIPHIVLDLSNELDQFVIEDFINEYLDGRTPNPCIRCNRMIKFGALLDKVKSLGADFMATGHYAKIGFNETTHQFELKKAADPKKDQSYFLYRIKKEVLPFILFPLGDIKKEEVRRLAGEVQLNTAMKPESQDICFVPDSGYKKFIKDRIGEEAFAPGPFVNERGEVVGEHKGIMNYTIGQRDKLGIALGYPVYVFKIDKENNSVYVGPKSSLLVKGLTARYFNPISIPDPQEGDTWQASVRIRYNAPEIKAKVTYLGEDKLQVLFNEPQTAVTPGQSVVMNEGDVILGGGIIHQAIALKAVERGQ